jgi:hypothetical protein
VPVPDDADISIGPQHAQGVLANACRAIALVDEVTIDFVRLDPFQPRGIVVSRLTCSPRFLRDLIDELEQIWHDWAWRSQPREEPP